MNQLADAKLAIGALRYQLEPSIWNDVEERLRPLFLLAADTCAHQERIAKLRAALEPFGLAADEADRIHLNIPDDHIWLWKPSSNIKKTHGINRAHLKAARDALAADDLAQNDKER